MGSYMEDLPIVLPVLQNKGLDRIGDLWNCQSSTSLGINVFDKELTKEDLKCFPLQKLDYQLRHIKNTKESSLRLHVGVEMKIEVFFGLITIRIGWGNFESTMKKSFKDELLSCDYQLETFRIKTLPGATSKINPKLKQQLIDGDLKATHMLAEVVLGADISSLIRLITTNTNNPEELSGNFLGKMVTSPISLAIKALQSLLSRKDDAPKVIIDVKSIPEITPSPSNIEEMFSFINKIEDTIQSQKHFPMITSHEIIGAPIMYILLPISKFLPDAKIYKLYKTIEANVLESLLEMITKLKDIAMPGYYKNQILERDSRLTVILSDSENPFSRTISEKEALLAEKAKKFEVIASNCFQLYKKGEKEEKDIDAILKEFWDSFSIISMCQDVDIFVAEGKNELGAILIDDLDSEEKESVLFITSKDQREDFLLTGRNMKLLLNSDTETKKANIFLSLYKISSRLKEFGVDVGVEMPNVSSGFSLAFRLKENYSTDIEPDLEYDETTAPFVLQVLTVAIDSGESNLTRFFHVYADLLGIRLPLEKTSFSDVTQIIKKLKDDLKDVIITESVLELRSHTCCLDGRLKFVLTLDSLCTLSESVEMFRFMKRKLKEKLPQLYKNSEWIIGTFGIDNYAEAPFLFLFQNKEIQSICLDKMDMYILLDILTRNSLNDKNSPLHPSAIANGPSFHNTRANYALHVLQMFEEGFSGGKAPFMSSIDSTENQSIVNIRRLAESIASKNSIGILSVVTDICSQFSPEIINTLQFHGWDTQEKSFPPGLIDAGKEEWAKDFKTSLEKFFVGQSQFMEEIDESIQKLKKCLRYNQFEDEREMDRCIQSILDGCHISNQMDGFPELRHGINSYKSATGRFKFQGYLNELEKQMNRIASSEPKYFHLRSLINFLEEYFIRQNSATQTEFLDIIENYLHTVKFEQNIYQGCKERIKDALKRGSIYQTLMLLAKCQYSENLFLLHSVMESSISPQLSDATNLKTIIRNLSEQGFTEKNFEELWSMPKFYFLMSKGKKDKGLLETINAYLCTSSKIPSYLPMEFVESLKLLILDAEEVHFDWNKKILELNDILQVFQEVAIRSLIPKDLQEILTNALNEVEGLKQQFRAAISKEKFYWNDIDGYFERPWDVESIKDAIDPIMNYMKEKFPMNPLGITMPPQNIIFTPPTEIIQNNNIISNLISLEDVADENAYLFQLLSMRNCNFLEYLQRHPEKRSQIISSLITAKNENTFEILDQMIRFQMALPLTIFNGPSGVKSLHSFLKLLQVNVQLPFQIIPKKLFSPRNKIVTVVNLGTPSDDCSSAKLLNGLMKNKYAFSENNFAGIAEIIHLTNATCSKMLWDEIVVQDFDQEDLGVLINIQGNILHEANRKLLKEIRKMSSCFIVFLMPDSWAAIQDNWNELKNVAGKTEMYFKLFINPKEECRFGKENILQTEQPQYENLISVLIEALKSETILNLNEEFSLDEFEMATTKESAVLVELVKNNKVPKLKQMLLNIHDPSFQSLDSNRLMKYIASLLNLPQKLRKIGLRHLEIELQNLQEIVISPFQRRIKAGRKDDTDEMMKSIVNKLEKHKIDVTLNVTHFLKAMERIVHLQDSQKLTSSFEQIVTDIVLYDDVDIELIQGDTWELQSKIFKSSNAPRTFVISVIDFEKKNTSSNFGGITMKIIHLDESLKENLNCDTVLLLRASFSDSINAKRIRQILSLTLFHSHINFIKLPSTTDNKTLFSTLIESALIISTLFDQNGTQIQSDIIFIDDTSSKNFGQSEFPELFKRVRTISEKWETLLGAQCRIEDKFFKVIMRIGNKQMTVNLNECKNESCVVKPNCFDESCTKNIFLLTVEAAKGLDSDSFLNLETWMTVFAENWDMLNKNDNCKFLLTFQSIGDLEKRMQYLVALGKTKNAVDSSFRFHRLRMEDQILKLSSKEKEEVVVKETEEMSSETEYSIETCSDEDCSAEEVDEKYTSETENIEESESEHEGQEHTEDLETTRDTTLDIPEFPTKEDSEDATLDIPEFPTKQESEDTTLDIPEFPVKQESEDTTLDVLEFPVKEESEDATLDIPEFQVNAGSEDTTLDVFEFQVKEESKEADREVVDTFHGESEKKSDPEDEDITEDNDPSDLDIVNSNSKRRHRHKKPKKKQIGTIDSGNNGSVAKAGSQKSYEWIDWAEEFRKMVSSFQLYPFICNPAEDNSVSSTCQCAEALKLKQELCSAFKASNFVVEADIDQYIKQISIATISKLTQMISSLDIEQKMRSTETSDTEHDQSHMAEIICKTLLDYQSSEVLPPVEEMIRLLRQNLSFKVLVPPARRSIELDLVKEYGKTIAQKIIRDDLGVAFDKIKAFEKSVSGSAYLSQKEIDILKYEISVVTQKIVVERQFQFSSPRPMGSFLADTYDSGTIRELKERMEKMLETLFPTSHDKLSLEFKWKVHAEAVKRLGQILSTTHQKWDGQFNPLQLQKLNICITP